MRKKCKEIADYFNKLTERTELGSGKGWLGIILFDLGFTAEEISDISTRGFVHHCEYYGDRVEIYTESAWSPCLDPIRLYLMHIGDEDVSFSYVADEPGGDLFLYYGEPRYYYYIDAELPENEYFHETNEIFYTQSEQETIEILEDMVKFPFASVEDCRRTAYTNGENSSEDYSLNICKFTECAPSEITEISDRELRKILKEKEAERR